ncbi:YesL family protein [Neobacillus dielmonensis]|uniref:YesL family protein n=1 Tax=Neobacillus dielmonensis TaxID=1347369 RepID=UPI0005A7EC7B|nr:YesL family protein [Neobacillus dielmonensis]
MSRIGERFNNFCIVVLKLVYIQLLWLLFTLPGFIVLGVGPSTYAMFTVIRQWIRGNKDIPIFETFYQSYRTGFKESALIGLLYLTAGIILYVDLLYIESQVLRGVLIVVGILYLISLSYIFPILVHYDWKGVKLKLKCSLLFGISYLQYTLMLFVVLAAVYFALLMVVPVTMVLFGVSIGSYIVMWLTHQVFNRIEMQAGAMEAKDPNQPLEGGGGA